MDKTGYIINQMLCSCTGAAGAAGVWREGAAAAPVVGCAQDGRVRRQVRRRRSSRCRSQV